LRTSRWCQARPDAVKAVNNSGASPKHVYDQGEGAQTLIIGTGQYGRVAPSPEGAEYLARKRCDVVLLPTPEVVATWNEAKGNVIGLFHVTC